MSSKKEPRRDPRIEVGIRVMIIGSHANLKDDRLGKDKFLGCTGQVTFIYSPPDEVPYVVKLDDICLEKRNDWCWRASEIMYLEDQNYVR